MQVRKQQLELDMEQQTASKLGKEYVKSVYCHPAYVTYAECIIRNAGLDEAQAGIKIARKNVNNLRYADEVRLMAESEELKSFLMKVKEESEKVDLKLNTSWQIDGETMETMTEFSMLSPKSLHMGTAAMK